MDRRRFLRSLGTGAAAVAAAGCIPEDVPDIARAKPGAAAPAATKPNVILIMTDDQGYGDLSCHGHPTLKTPHLDALHAQSTRFTDFHVSPTCSPTRAALMTGRYNNRTGVWHTIMGRSILLRDEVTMADVFAANGYRTGFFGKWHLGDNYPFRPEDRGFQTVWRHGGGGVGQTPDYWGNDYLGDTYWIDGKPTKFEGYCTDVWFDGVLKFVEANRERPFFAYVPTNAPHGPFISPPEYPNQGFYGMIRNIDDNMGRLMKRLNELGLERDTILIFMTDNGTAAGNFPAGMRGRKGSEYDGGHRVPFFIRWPGGGVPAGRDVRTLSAHIDVLPTLMELCGLRSPSEVAFDGRSLASFALGRITIWPGRAIVVDSQRIPYPQKWRRCAVMTREWRLVNGKQLYDIRNDPGQKRDVAAEHPAEVANLRAAYERWWESISPRFDTPARTVLGSESENPLTLTCHDWHQGKGPTPWNHGHIRKGVRSNGHWEVEVEREGTYEIELRRWPREANAAVASAVPGGKAIPVARARVRVAGLDRTVEAAPGAVAARVTGRLAKGPSKFETSFIDAAGKELCGAYFVYVKRLP
ncbi:MAG: arylsulfatase [Planctomycetota bacterium]|jgi:arylsulfatase B